ncbi:MAG: transcriptional coactivator p15/PC4 family protein [Candidatus Sabulitectum sp.]|nr:transcriptional coactivator p15/PC4 family protein [Candidatus Sabulitectum sp.]
MNKQIAQIEKGEDVVRIALTEFRKRQYIEIRTYYMADDGEWKPTRKGITLNPDLMKEVHQALGKALEDVENAEDIETE